MGLPDPMNVFVLSTGRCGSTALAHACSHITNYTSAHESRCAQVGEARLAYAPDHIEIDNRLSWYLGRLDRAYGDSAFYVHLRRADTMKTAVSCSKRTYAGTIMNAYKHGILLHCPEAMDALELSLDYIATVTANIDLFLRDKTQKMDFTLENAGDDFREFWNRIGAQGDFEAGLAEFQVRHNPEYKPRSFGEKVISKLAGLASKSKEPKDGNR